jgi:hypothetical protein
MVMRSKVGKLDAEATDRPIETAATFKRVALIGRDNRIPKRTGAFDHRRRGFAPFLTKAIIAADKNKADLIVFSGWSYEANSTLGKAEVFPPGTTHSAVVLQRFSEGRSHAFEIHVRSADVCGLTNQLFLRSRDQNRDKEKLISRLMHRKFGNAILIICGETNIIGTETSKRPMIDRKPSDKFGALEIIKNMNVDIVINPVHTYMKRPEMQNKRSVLSKAGKLTVSVWNRGLLRRAKGSRRKPAESDDLWTAYRDGRKVEVEEIRNAVEDQPRIRIGIIDIRAV